jgi:hypothetical protein
LNIEKIATESQKMTDYLRLLLSTSCAIVALVSVPVLATEGTEHHHHKNHIALLIGHAEEEQADGHHESGAMVGVEYYRQIINEHWRIGAAFEMESFGDNHARYGVIAIPASYFFTPGWRVFVAPGMEFGEDWETTDAMIRIGTGYTFNLTERFSISPEVQVDFVEGGKEVYVLSLAFGLGF